MNKILAFLASASVIITPSLTVLSSAPNTSTNNSAEINKEEENILDKTIKDKKNYLREDILSSRISGGKVNYSEYDGKKFHSAQDLDQYILQNNMVEPYLTTSNPYKIIKNYEYMTLDENKVYDANLDNFVKIYRDAYGNVAYSVKEAMNTYVNRGSIKPQYSYDGYTWFDSPEEAKIQEKYKLEINKSIYYLYNNRYYNAFNKKDIEALISKFDNGYYAQINKDLNGNTLVSPIKVSGNSHTFYDLTKKKFDKMFNRQYMNKIIETDINFKVRISAKSSVIINYFSDLGDGQLRDSKTLDLELLIPESENIKNFDDLETWFKSGWSEGYEGKNRKKFTTRTIRVKKNGKKGSIRFNVMFKNDKRNAPINGFYLQDLSLGSFRLYKDENKYNGDLMDWSYSRKGVYSLDNILTEERNRFYNKWFENYYNSTLTNFGDKQNEYVKYDDFLDNKFITNKYYNSLNNKGIIYKDKIYNINWSKGYGQSLIQSYQNWQIQKTKIINDANSRKKDNKGQTTYKLREDFYATKEQLDNFLYLEGDFSYKIMYSYSTTPDVSDQEGKQLASSLEEAKEKKMINSKMTLRKQYKAYDNFGQEVISAVSGEDAIERLQREISLTSRYVHKREIASWNNFEKKSWDSIISDGRYFVYRIQNPNQQGSFIYYPSQDLALAAIKSNAKIASDVNKLEEDVYIYNYTNSKGQLVPIVFYGNNVDMVLEKIEEIETNINKFNL